MAFNSYAAGSSAPGGAPSGGVANMPRMAGNVQRTPAVGSQNGRTRRRQRPPGYGSQQTSAPVKPQGVAPGRLNVPSMPEAMAGTPLIQEGADPTGLQSFMGNQMQQFALPGPWQPGSPLGMANMKRRI